MTLGKMSSGIFPHQWKGEGIDGLADGRDPRTGSGDRESCPIAWTTRRGGAWCGVCHGRCDRTMTGGLEMRVLEDANAQVGCGFWV